MGEDRRGLKKIVRMAVENKIRSTVVTYPDKLTRFDPIILETFLNNPGVEIVEPEY